MIPKRSTKPNAQHEIVEEHRNDDLQSFPIVSPQIHTVGALRERRASTQSPVQTGNVRITRGIIIVAFLLRIRCRRIRGRIDRLRRIRTLKVPFHSRMRRQIDLLMVAQVAVAADRVHVGIGGVGAEDHAFMESGAAGAKGGFERGAV